MTTTTKRQTTTSQILRDRLDQVRARYDSGAMSPGVYQAVKQIELEIAWCEHKGGSGRDSLNSSTTKSAHCLQG